MKTAALVTTALLLLGCSGTHTVVAPSTKPSIKKSGNHIWIRPGTNGNATIQITR